MLASIQSQFYHFTGWTRRHKRAVVLTTAAVAATYYVARRYYLASAQRERDAWVAAQNVAEEAAHARMQGHFESIQRIADTQTVPSVLPKLKEELLACVDLHALIAKLQAPRDSSEALPAAEKLKAWEQLKILSFTRTLTGMTAASLLELFIRVQLNILGRYVYMDAALDSKGLDGHRAMSLACQHTFLAYADYLPKSGLGLLVAHIQDAVQDVVGSLSLKTSMTHEDLRDALTHIRASFEGKAHRIGWAQYLIPLADEPLPATAPTGKEPMEAEEGSTALQDDAEDARVLANVLKETRVILRSDECHAVLSEALDAAFELMLRTLRQSWGSSELGKDVLPPSDTVVTKPLPLAKVVPLVAGVGPMMLAPSPGNEYLKAIASLPSMDSFCALVYASPPAPRDAA
eukprot:jgi/Chlat1/1292/Chrsp118S01731